MPLERLEPEVKRYVLGPVRVWQDEIAEIVRLVSQLPDVALWIESNGYRLTDVKTDLPALGAKLRYFTVRAEQVPPSGMTVSLPVVKFSVTLDRQSCVIEATDPNLEMMGLIQSIQSLLGPCRRLPRWLSPSLFSIMTDFNTSNAPAAMAPVVSLSPAPAAGLSVSVIRSTRNNDASALGLLLLMGSLALAIIFAVGAIQHLVHYHGKPIIAWPLSISVLVPCLIPLAALIVGASRSLSLLFAGTREDAPTFWQRKRSDIAINIVVGFLFFLLGLLAAHL
jgi:hypothetical protein